MLLLLLATGRFQKYPVTNFTCIGNPPWYPHEKMQVESRLLVAVPMGLQPPEVTAQRIFRELKPRTELPAIRVQFRPFTNLSSRIRLREGRIIVGISDLLREAPEPVIEALLWILLSKLYRRAIPNEYQQRYREFVNQEEFREGLGTLRQTRGRKQIAPPAGACFDLEEVFETVNARHFGGRVSRPQLGWSRQRARTLLGHYDPHHHMIVLSSLLDHPRVPRLVVDFVMYHEMLHIQIPVTHRGSRRSVHPPEFRAAERQFPAYAEAKAFLKLLNITLR